MVVRGQRRRGAVVATAVAGGVAVALLVSGCSPMTAAYEPQAGRAGRPHSARPVHGTGAVIDPGRALATVRGAAAALAREGGAKVVTSMETVSGGTRLTIQGSGVYDFARPVGELTVLLPEDATGAAEHRPITEVFTPGGLYMKNRGAGVPADKWVRLDTAALPDGNLLTSGATDPLAAAGLLGGAREVTYMRDERVGGVRVGHYWGTIDLGRAARAAPVRDRGPLAAAAKGFSSGTVAFDVLIDAQGRPRELRYRFSVESGRGDTGDGGAGGDPAADGSGARSEADGGATTATAIAAATATAVRPSPAATPMVVVSTVRLSAFGTGVRVVLPAPGDIYAGKVGSPQK
ncbi:hypothetical protein AB8O64_20635 [Streptomyces sp. QH1-20]|uniref:hypothetical protein n=1 Tax=Streptomyces sp. QH1-20 TaxID=3240934 RepID=UPI003514B4C9